MKTMINSRIIKKGQITLVIMLTIILSSCELHIYEDKPNSFYEGRWEIYSLVSNLTGMEYNCYGIMDVEWEYDDFYYYMDLYDWPYYADYGIVVGDHLYNDRNIHYATLEYNRGRLFINTRAKGFEFSFRARRI